MEIHRYIIIIFILISAPALVFAGTGVRINEVAWMGTKTSANAEWLELFNSSNKDINLNGWTLTGGAPTSKHISPHIHFSAKDSIGPHGYFLLERTRNGAVAGVNADKIYTGSLKNTGETLFLVDSASTTIDKVIGGKNWCTIGGNNSTKQTAQRTTSGWVTATGTPRIANTISGKVSSCAKSQSTNSASSAGAVGTTTTSTASSTSQSNVPVTTSTSTISISYSGHYGPPEFEPVPAVFVSIGKDKDIVAGADIRFGAVVTDKAGKQYKSAIVYWAFGDGSKATGTSVFKNYSAPGTYAVVANAVQGLGSGEDDMVVVVHDAHVSIPSISKYGITIKNKTPYRLDMSFWKLRASTTTFAFPQHTVILPNTSVLFPKNITTLPLAQDTVLLYPNGKEAARYTRTKSYIKNISVQQKKKLSVGLVRYSTVQGSKKRNVQPVAQKDIINSYNSVSAYDTKASIAPAVATKIATAGAPVARAFIGNTYPTSSTEALSSVESTSSPVKASTTSFIYRFLSVPLTLPLILILILSVIAFIFL